ncbi:RUS family member 1-like [Styela clava]
MDKILCVERFGSNKQQQHTIYTHDGLSRKMKPSGGAIVSKSVTQVLKSIFLPQGYPDSVSDDYLEYQIWDTIQAFCSSITGALATQAVLKGSGVGDETANVASATVTWLLKDGTGMVGRIAFAYYQGANLDRDAKRWRLFADVLNDCAICVTLVAPLFPKSFFTPITCVAGLAFSLVGVAGGCTRAALTVHQARRNNMADVSAKDGSQETMVNLAALIINLFLTPIVSGNIQLTWILFAIFTFFHIYSNYKAVSCVIMNTFNYSRLKIVIDHCFLSPGYGEILDPVAANLKEPVVLGFPDPNIRAGCMLREIDIGSEQFIHTLKTNPNTKFISSSKQGIYCVAFRDIAIPEDVIKAYFEAHIGKISNHMKPENAINWTEFSKELQQKGWDINRHQLSVDEWRWSTEEFDKIK